MSFRVSPSERRRTLHFHLAAAFAALCSLAPPLAHASNIPYPPNCTIPSHVVLTGLDAHGAADPLGTMTFEIRSLVNLPLNNAVLAIDFGQTPDVRPSEVQPDPSVTQVFCAAGGPIVQAFTDINGRVTIRLVGRAYHSAASGAHAPTLQIFCNGVFLSTVPVSAFDQDGGGGLNPADESLFFSDFFSGQYWARSDFDGNGALGPNDLSLWEQAFFASNSVQSGAGTCP